MSSCLAVGKSLYSSLVSTAGDISGISNPINPSFRELADICIRSLLKRFNSDEEEEKQFYSILFSLTKIYDENVGSRS